MNFIRCKDYEEMSREAAKRVIALLKEKPDATLGLATGSTPVGMYRELVAAYRAGTVSFARVHTFNLDEYYPIRKDDAQSYDTFMREHLFDQVDLPKENIRIPNGEAKDAAVECRTYEDALRAAGYTDLQVLGIGRNGHVGFNEPGDALCAVTHLTPLTESTVAANARFFASEDEVPKHALTMGLGSILGSRHILLLISGKDKHDALAALRDDRITTEVPATLLKTHPNVDVIFDEAAE